MRGVHRTFTTGATCQQRTLTLPDTWSCPTLGLACVLMSRPIPSELVLFPDFRTSLGTSLLLKKTCIQSFFVRCVNARIYIHRKNKPYSNEVVVKWKHKQRLVKRIIIDKYMPRLKFLLISDWQTVGQANIQIKSFMKSPNLANRFYKIISFLEFDSY